MFLIKAFNYLQLSFFIFFLAFNSTLSRATILIKTACPLLAASRVDEGTKKVLIWGYNNSLVIAQVTNAKYDQVYHTSFEEEPSNTVSTVSYAKTGQKVKSGSFVIPSDKRPVAGQYSLSFWKRININNEWKWEYHQEIINYTPSDTPIIDASFEYDELRIHPVNAFMTTFTYNPLIGKTSQTGPNGITLYYEYDEHYCLKFVRDQEGNILKNYYYHYKSN